MHKVSLIFSGILFLLGCLTLGAAMFISIVLPKIFDIYLMAHPVSYTSSILNIDVTNIYLLAFAELLLGAVGYLYHRKKAESKQ